jgi:hypothetical protein
MSIFVLFRAFTRLAKLNNLFILHFRDKNTNSTIGDSNPGPLKWDVNRGGYVNRYMDRIPNGFVPQVNIDYIY